MIDESKAKAKPKKKSAAEKKSKEFMSVVAKYKYNYGIKDQDICDCLGISKATWNARKHDIGFMTLRELSRLINLLIIPTEEIIKFLC